MVTSGCRGCLETLQLDLAILRVDFAVFVSSFENFARCLAALKQIRRLGALMTTNDGGQGVLYFAAVESRSC